MNTNDFRKKLGEYLKNNGIDKKNLQLEISTWERPFLKYKGKNGTIEFGRLLTYAGGPRVSIIDARGTYPRIYYPVFASIAISDIITIFSTCNDFLDDVNYLLHITGQHIRNTAIDFKRYSKTFDHWSRESKKLLIDNLGLDEVGVRELGEEKNK